MPVNCWEQKKTWKILVLELKTWDRMLDVARDGQEVPVL